jgi:NTE family protein
LGIVPPETTLSPAVDRRRELQRTKINADHVLASAALPGLFPTRKIGDSCYCDGGVRFNTRIAPALRAGANRLLVIPRIEGRAQKSPPADQESPSFFLFGKLLNALLLDPVDYDLAVLERFNHLLATMDELLDPGQLTAVERVMEET